MYQGRFGASQSSSRPVKPQASVGTTIFYTLYVFFILLFCLSTFLGLRHLDGWLQEFEDAQPEVRAEEVFCRYFQEPDWAQLYTLAGFRDTQLETSATFAGYMEQRQEGQALEPAFFTGSSGTMTWQIFLEDEAVAAFTLENKNYGDTSLFALPDWQLHSIDLFASRDQTFRIQVPEGSTVQVNGISLSDSYLMQISTPVAASFLPGSANVPRTHTYVVQDLFFPPEMTVLDKEGSSQEMVYSEADQTFQAASLSPQIPEALSETVLETAKAHALWMAGLSANKKTLARYFHPSSDAYATLTGSEYPSRDDSYTFLEPSISRYQPLGASAFYARVDMTLMAGENAIPYQYFLVFRQFDDSWQCIYASEEDLSQHQGRVRITFMYGDTPASSDFFHTGSSEIITPVLNAPDGKVFAGWVDKEGTLVFQPDSTGRVALPKGQTLSPMTLYAHFETLGGN